MDFLRPMFNSEIDSEGDINILGSVFKRSRILEELEPKTHEILFAEWLEERKSRLIEKADAILTLYDNADRFDQLKRSFKSGNLRPFIGAGMSIASGYPGWTSFLYKLCKESHVKLGNLEELINNGNYDEAAQTIYDDLGASLFNENLESAYLKTCDIDGPIQYLPVLFPECHIVTTNFDNIIEKLFEDNENGFDLVVSGVALDEVLRNIASGSRLLIKLHGDCRIIANRVLIESEYDIHYAENGLVKRFFNRVLFGNSFLFLGCSLRFDRTIKTMIEIVNENGASSLPRHYAFLSLDETEDRVARKKNLAQANIFPIWYPNDDHDESIEALLIKLKEDQ